MSPNLFNLISGILISAFFGIILEGIAFNNNQNNVFAYTISAILFITSAILFAAISWNLEDMKYLFQCAPPEKGNPDQVWDYLIKDKSKKLAYMFFSSIIMIIFALVILFVDINFIFEGISGCVE